MLKKYFGQVQDKINQFLKLMKLIFPLGISYQTTYVHDKRRCKLCSSCVKAILEGLYIVKSVKRPKFLICTIVNNV